MWERGGEFAKYETEAKLESEWLKGDAILQKLQLHKRALHTAVQCFDTDDGQCVDAKGYALYTLFRRSTL